MLFDLDWVLTRTADVHAAAWKRLLKTKTSIDPDHQPEASGGT